MIVNSFKNIVMSALFGDLAGYPKYQGITHLASSEGLEIWDSGIIPEVLMTDSGLRHEVFRSEIEEAYFLNQVLISGTNLSGCSVSGLIVNLSEGYPSYHFNELVITIRSGTDDIPRIIESYSLESGTILFYSGVTGLDSKEQISYAVINDVIALGGTPTNDVLFKFKLRSNETQQHFIREEGMVGAGSTSELESGSFANIVRYLGRPTFGSYFEVAREHRLSISSGFFIR